MEEKERKIKGQKERGSDTETVEEKQKEKGKRRDKQRLGKKEETTEKSSAIVVQLLPPPSFTTDPATAARIRRVLQRARCEGAAMS